jgi:hypothetical protein
MPYDIGPITETNADLLILQKARDRIARGWGHGIRCLWPWGKNLCIGLTLCAVGVEEDATEKRLLAALGFHSSRAETIAWNDAPGRTQAEVLQRFDAAIDRLAGRGAGG